MVSGPLTFSEKVLAALAVTASVTVAVKLLFAATLGVPEMTPVEALSVKPAGSAPDVIDHVYGVVPPLADNVVL